MPRWRGIVDLVHDAVEHTTDLVEDAHESAARRVVDAVSLAEPLAGPAQTADKVRSAYTSTVFASIRGVHKAVAAASDLGLDALERRLGEEEGEPTGPVADALLGAVNAVVGDHLRARDNPLDLGMHLRTVDGELDLGPGARPGSRVAVFVHGLAATERGWFSGDPREDPEASFGTRLERDLGLVPLWLRYNSGRGIADSGADLDAALEDLHREWPGGLEEIVLVGHSMGGLVCRSAVHLAHERGAAWLGALTHVVTLSSPHRGAPLEKLGQAADAVFGALDTPETMVFSRVLGARSAGIRDLGFERDEPLVEGITWTFIATAVTESPDHPLGKLVGDLMVRVPSAEGPARRERFDVRTHRLGGMAHNTSLIHPVVYARILEVLGG